MSSDVKKIVHVVGGLNFGGVESVLINYFSYMDHDKYDLYIISHEIPNPKCAEIFEKLGFKIYNVPSKHESLIKNIKMLYKLFKQIKPDIVHCHLTLSNYAPLIIAKICGIKHRISHSHLTYENKSLVQKIYCFLISKFANYRVACTKASAVYLYGKKDSIILNNAIKLQDYKFDKKIRTKVRKKLKIDDETILYGHIGRFHPQKNHEFLISIFNDIHKKNKNSKLLLIGNGELKEEIKEKIDTLNLSEAVIMLESCPNVGEYYNAMDLFIFPSLYEGLGMVVIEAQVNGLPCIISDTIPSEVKLTDLVTFIPLCNSSIQWAETIFDFSINFDREKYFNIVSESKYNIEKEAQKLQNLYNSILKD